MSVSRLCTPLLTIRRKKEDQDMNIKQAKQQLINTVRAYLETDEYGRYLIPQHKQRPIFLMGPPGIGKTEIMSQTAAELGIGLLSYSMTHHTRQSAIGLPIIKQKEYGGETFDASEYTMSEIIASIYDMMKASGIEKGILFLDEINCVSETLTPVMLQFLQYKVFGGKRLPDGWIVVTAGNPPEYNSSVREFDVVTWDRLKRIDVEPDLGVWKEYAAAAGLNGAVVTYLGLKPQSFYRMESTAGGRSFVTARGWEDLSRILSVYERLDIEADKELVSQYIQDKKTAEDFSVYYGLYRKYRSDYQISEILDGKASHDIEKRAAAARFDERYSLIGLMLETVSREAGELLAQDADLLSVKRTLGGLKGSYEQGDDVSEMIAECIASLDGERERLYAANSLTPDKDGSILFRRGLFERYRLSAVNGFSGVRETYDEDIARFKSRVAHVSAHFSNMFGFCERVFGSGQELLILVTELTADPITARFISEYGCEEYYRCDKELMFYERRLEIIDELQRLERSYEQEQEQE